MRRLVATSIGVGLALMLAVCGGIAYVGAAPPQELVPAGATQVHVEQLGIGRQRITYIMPPRLSVSEFRTLLQQRGWRLIRVPGEERSLLRFVRTFEGSTIRETITFVRPRKRNQLIVMMLTRCLKVERQSICI